MSPGHALALFSNVRSLNSQYVFDELSHLAHHHKVGFVALTETWLKQTTLDCERAIASFTLFRYDRVTVGGGVALYVADTYTSHVVQLFDPGILAKWSTDLGLEILTVKTGNHITELLISVIYRSPSFDNHSQLRDVLSVISHYCSTHDLDSLILGDFNYRKIDWVSYSSTAGACAQARDFLATTLDLHLTQPIKNPTRQGGANSTPSVLDLALTTDPDLVFDIQNLPGVGKSDHDVLLLKVSFTPNPQPDHSRPLRD